MKNQNILKDKSYLFAVRTVKFYKFLIDDKKEFILSKQVLRSGTSIGAMVEEALQGESKIFDLEELIKLLVSIIKTAKNSVAK